MTSFNRRSYRIGLLHGGAALTFALFATSGMAQESGGETTSASDTNDIIVTAQRREQNIQDVGLSVTALGAETLARLGINNATDIAEYVPNLRFTSLGGSVVQYNIRGVSQNGYADHLEPPVAIYADDAYLSTSTQASLPVFDLERVEVLRGPQGTLFGRNATGGLIQFISAQPTEATEGYVDVTISDDMWGKVEGAISGPLSENLQGRVAVAISTREGYVRNTVDDSSLGDEHYVAARAILAYQPTSNLDVNLNVRFYKNFDQSGTPYTFAATVADADGLGRFVGPDENPYGTCNGCGPAFYEGFQQSNPYVGALTSSGNFRRRAAGGTLKFDWDLGDVNLISITDYQDLFKTFYEDVDAAPQYIADDFHSQDLTHFTQEFRAVGGSDTFRWTGGVYLFYQRSESVTAYNLFDGVVTPVESADMKTHSAAIYAQAEYDIIPEVTAILGGRYTYEKKKIDHYVVDEGLGLPDFAFNPTLYPDLAKQNFNLYSARAELQWRPVDRMMFYASFSRGTKGGAFSLPTYLPINPLAIPFGDETLHAFEVGQKWTFLDGKARLNSALFYYDYKDYQAFNFRTIGDVPVGTILNTDATVKGAEVDLTLWPTEGLQLNFTATTLDSKAKNVTLPSGRVVDRDLPQSPSFAGTASIRYEKPVAANRVAAIQFDANHTGKQSFTVLSAPNEREGAYTVGNLRVSLASEDGSWEAALFAKNLWNERYRIFAFDLSSIGTIAQSFVRPRTIGASFRYNFW